MSDQIQYWSDMTTHEGHHGESVYGNIYNESTTGADASVEALKLHHMKLTV